MRQKPKIIHVRPAGENHQVVTVQSDAGAYRKKPCRKCPWRKDAAGEFPAEAFRHSASTSYDMAQSTFACHEAGKVKPAICAGFLLRGAEHNLSVRMAKVTGKFLNEVTDGGHALHANYRAMAIANGVGPDEPVLKPCRD